MDRILCILMDKFKCDKEAISLYAQAAKLRYDGATNAFYQVTNVLNNVPVLRRLLITQDYTPGDASTFPLTLDQTSLLQELKYLNVKNIEVFLEWKGINPRMREYLEALVSEIKSPSLVSPSSNLQQKEAIMLDYTLNQPFEENRDKIQCIANSTLRVILQTWLLHPNLICNKADAQTLIDCLYISNCEI